jgi:chorismate dehydratase
MSVATHGVSEPAASDSTLVQSTRLGVVRYLNTRPLIAGLESLEGLRLRPEVPADLIGALERGEVDAALCSSVDYQRSERDLVILPVGLLGCDGPTLTVQVFSRVPLDRVRRLHADMDSHTSRVLAQLVLAHRSGRRPEMVDLTGDAGSVDEAVLLIGDKVVLQPPDEASFPHRLDLGHAWREMTGLPFTFACWMAPRPVDATAARRLATLSAVLDHQRRRNLSRRAALGAVEGPRRGWSADTAVRYLCELLRFEWSDRHREGLRLFWSKAAEAGCLPSCRPLHLLEAWCPRGQG